MTCLVRGAMFVVVSVLVLQAAACAKRLSTEGEAWLSAIERAIDHGVNLSISVCKPDRADDTAWQAQATATGFHELMDEELSCARAEGCQAPGAGPRRAEVEAALSAEAQKHAIAARETLTTLLAAPANAKKTRAHVTEVLTDAIATADASAKLIRACGSPARHYDMSQAMTDVDEARARFRSAIKAMRSDP